MYELTPREKEALAKADELNAYLSMSSIPEGAAAAQLRAREQATARLQQRQTAADFSQLDATLGVRQQGDRMQYDIYNQMLNPTNPALAGGPELPAREEGQIMDDAQAFTDYAGALSSLEELARTGQSSEGWRGVAVDLLREGDKQTAANVANTWLFNKNETAARALVSAAHAQQRQAMSGMAVTDTELGFSADNDPTMATTLEEQIQRLKLRQGIINNHRTAVGLPPLQSAANAPQGAPQLSESARRYLQE